MSIIDENKEEEQKKLLETIKNPNNSDSQNFDAQHDAWYKRDMAALKAKKDAQTKKEGGHVKTELDDKKEEELTDEDKAKKSAEQADEAKIKAKNEAEEAEKNKKIDKDAETWTAEMP